ncbi:MAG: tail fiber domain-containing protein, partial [Deltaproteobacteria bacterium]|nr:tail fiber domain-containing protein [Deltaproteobacteria bacterium]
NYIVSLAHDHNTNYSVIGHAHSAYLTSLAHNHTADYAATTHAHSQYLTSLAHAHSQYLTSLNHDHSTFLNKSGDTMSGTLTFSGVTNDITTVSNQHIALMPNGTGNVGIGTTAPSSKLEVNGTVTAPTFSGSLSGNASTATALAANPADCGANQFATSIAADGTLGCVALTDASIPNDISAGNADTLDGAHASAFASATHGHSLSHDHSTYYLTSLAHNHDLNYAGINHGHSSLAPASHDHSAYVLDAGDTMTGALTFSGVASDISTVSNENLALMPNGSGNVGVGTTAPTYFFDVAGKARLGSASTSGELTIFNSAVDLGVTLKTSDTTGAYSLTLPISAGADGQYLKVGANGVLSWDSITGDAGGDLTDVNAGNGISVSNSTGPAPTVSINYSSNCSGAGDKLLYNGTNGTWSCDTDLTGITGSGTLNYVTKFFGSGSVGDSIIYDNGTNVGIGTTAPDYKLSVAGTANVTGTTTLSNTLSVSGDASLLGNVAIGTTAVSKDLTVNGLVSATRYTSTVANGTSPFAITSTTLNTNLNADLLDGLDSGAFASSGHTHSAYSQNLFETINASSGTDPVADSTTDTLNLSGGGIVTVTGDSSTDTITISATEVDGSTSNELQNIFQTFDAPAGTDPVADSTTDTLTLAAGGIVSITGNAASDTLTISATEVDGSTTNELSTLTCTNAATSCSGSGTTAYTITGDATGDCDSGYFCAGGHGHSGYQASDATLSALASYNTNGLLTQTAADTFTGRTLTGTTFDVAVSNGNGVSGNPTLTLDRTATLAADPALTANYAAFATTGLIFEGATANANETLVTVTDPTADRTITIPDASGTVAVSASAPLSLSAAGALSITQANGSTNGYLSSGDWTTFNSKQASGNYITALTGDVTASGPGSVGATIANDAVALTTDTTGNYVATVAGTMGQITVSGADGEGATKTVSLSNGTASGQVFVTGASPYAPALVTMNGDATIGTTGTVAIAANAVALGTDTTGNYVLSVTGGAGIVVSGSAGEGWTPTVNTASTEAAFLTDGGSTSLTCGASNQGKMQVLDSGALEYCDGATTSVLKTGFLDADGIDSTNDTVSGDELDGTFSTTGLLKRTGASTYSTITDNSANWDSAASHSTATSNVHGLTFTAEGSGGGLDADTVDGSHAAAFVLDAGDTMTGALTMSGANSNIVFSSVTNDITTGLNQHLALMPNGTGNVGIGTTAPTQKLEVNGSVNATSFIGSLIGNADTATTATNATNTAITDDTTTNATMYPTWVTTASGNQAQKVSSSKLTFNPSSGTLTATTFAGDATSVDGHNITATTDNRLVKHSGANLADSGISDGSDAIAVTINSSENVGIGTTMPTTKLQVSGALTLNGAVSDIVTAGNEDLLLVPAGTGNVGIGNTGAIRDLVVTGNVGVGSTVVTKTLTVNNALQLGSNGADGSLTIYSEQGATDYNVVFQPNAAMSESTTYTLPSAKPAASAYLTSNSSGALSWSAAGTGGSVDADTVDGSHAAAFVLDAGDTMTGSLVFSGVTNDITTVSNQHIALMPNGTGNVGVGTNGPTSKLEVVGGAELDNLYDSADASNFFDGGPCTYGISNIDSTGAFTCASAQSGMSSFQLAGTSGSTQTIANGDTVTIAAGTGITTSAGATDTVTVSITADSVGDTQLAYNTGQHLTTTSTVAFGGLNVDSNTLYVDAADNEVGIGTNTPSQALHVVGDAYKTEGGNTWAATSDGRLKNILGEVNDGLAKVLALNPVKFKYNDKMKELYGGENEKEHYGFIAQEVEKIIPEFIGTDPNGYLTYNPSGMEAILVSALQEQQKVIAQQKEDLAKQNEEITKQKEEIEKQRLQISQQDERLKAIEAALQTLQQAR